MRVYYTCTSFICIIKKKNVSATLAGEGGLIPPRYCCSTAGRQLSPNGLVRSDSSHSPDVPGNQLLKKGIEGQVGTRELRGGIQYALLPAPPPHSCLH